MTSVFKPFSISREIPSPNLFPGKVEAEIDAQLTFVWMWMPGDDDIVKFLILTPSCLYVLLTYSNKV